MFLAGDDGRAGFLCEPAFEVFGFVGFVIIEQHDMVELVFGYGLGDGAIACRGFAGRSSEVCFAYPRKENTRHRS